jgi:hypothetical protein
MPGAERDEGARFVSPFMNGASQVHDRAEGLFGGAATRSTGHVDPPVAGFAVSRIRNARSDKATYAIARRACGGDSG